MRRQFSNRRRDIKTLEDTTFKLDKKEYYKRAYVYRLTVDSGEEFNGGVLEGEFVSKVFGNLNDGTSEVNLFWVPDPEFQIDGEVGVINYKPKPSSVNTSLDVNTFFPQFIWKEFKTIYTDQTPKTKKIMRMIMFEEPQIDPDGKITTTDVYLLYSIAEDGPFGNFVQSRITLSILDSNVAKNSADEYIIFNHYLKPIIPTNARYLKITPTTLFARSAGAIEIQDADSNVILPTLPIEHNPLLPFLQLDFWKYKVVGLNFQITSALQSEYEWQRELYYSFIDENIIDKIGRAAFESGIILPTDTFIDENYRYYEQASYAFVGISKFTEEFKNYLNSWRIGGFNSVYSQLPQQYVNSNDEGVVQFLRQTYNWISNKRYFLNDIYWLEATGLGGIDSLGQAFVRVPTKNTEFELGTASNGSFNKNFFENAASIDGLVFDKMKDLIESTFTPNIENIVENDGWVLTNRKETNIYKPFNWNKKAITAGEGTIRNNILNLPDPYSTFGAGLYVDKDLFTNKNRNDANYAEDFLIFDLGEERTISKYTDNVISGNFYIEWLDENFQPALGQDRDGTLVQIGRREIKSPQEVQVPLNTRITIIYI